MAELNLAEPIPAESNTEAQIAQALTHLTTLLTLAGFDAEAAEESRYADTITFAVTGPDAPLLVGMHGQTLDAFQYLIMLMTNKGQPNRIRVTLDADGYRARRARKLTDFANELAAEVGKSGQEAITDALNPMERRLIHTALVDHPDVETYSEGDEPNRFVVVTPRRSEK
ncbi:MAG: protein jag [Janthinobacterium lividum]